VNQGEGTNQ
jgi:hypothetical protein